MSFVNKINSFTNKIGHGSAYLILPMVFITFAVVILRYGLGIGKIWLQELIIYFHATFFVMGISYNLLKNTHVRVDVFFSKFNEKQKTYVNLLGSVFFIIPVFTLILYKSWPYVYQSFIIFESSPDAGGLPGRFLIKALIPLLSILVLTQTISLILKSLEELKTKPK